MWYIINKCTLPTTLTYDNHKNNAITSLVTVLCFFSFLQFALNALVQLQLEYFLMEFCIISYHNMSRNKLQIIIRELKQKRSVTFADATVEQDAPRKPHRTGEIQSILLCIITLRQFEPAEWTEPVQ